MTVTSNIVLSVATWQSSHAYLLGDLVTTSFPRAYQCTKAGTSASSGGPTGTTSSITDGSVTWKYICDVNYTTLQSWANAIPSTLTQPYIGQVLSSGLINVDASVSTLTPYLTLTGHTTSPTNTITLTAFPGFGHRDKLTVPGTSLAINTSAVGFVVALRNAQYDVAAFKIVDANVIVDGLQFRKSAPYSPAVFPGGSSFVLNGHTYAIATLNTNITQDGVPITGGDGTASLAHDATTIYGENGSNGDWFAWVSGSTFTGPSYNLELLSTDSAASNFVLRNCILDGVADSFSTTIMDNSCQGNFYNNLFFDRQGEGGTSGAIRNFDSASTAGSSWVNNTFIRTYANASTAFVYIGVPGNSGGYVFRNNLSTGSGTVLNSATTANADHTATDYSSAYSGSVVNGGGNVTSITPSNVFVDTTFDFHLKQGASIINAGTSDTTHIPSATDIIGNPRAGTTWDIGAVEFTVSASAATKVLQFTCAATATKTNPSVNAAATAAIIFTAAANLTSQDRASAAIPVLSLTANVQLGSQTLTTGTSGFNIGVLFSFVRQEIFVSATNSILLKNAITAQLWDICSLIQPIFGLKTSAAATFNPYSAYGGGAIIFAGGALLTHPTLASASSNLVYSFAGTATILSPFDCTALASIPITARGTLQAPELKGFASLPTITSSAHATFGTTIIPAAGLASIGFSAAISLSSSTNATARNSLVVSTAAVFGGSDPVTALATPWTFSAAVFSGQQLVIPTPVITLPSLTVAGTVGSSCYGIGRFGFTTITQAGKEVRAAGTSRLLTIGTPQPASLLLQTDGNTPVQLSYDRTNVWISDLVMLPWASFPLRADSIGQPTVLLSTNTSVSTTWPTITSASHAINSLGAHGADVVLTFTAIATGTQFTQAAAAIPLNVTATVTASQNNLANGSAVLPTLTVGAASAQLQNTASTATTASINFVANGQLGQSNPVSASAAVPITLSAQAVTSQLASASVLWPTLGIGDGGGIAVLGSGVSAVVPLLTVSAAGSLGQNNLISAAASLPALTPVVSVIQEALTSATVVGLQITAAGHMIQFWEAEALINWPPLTAYSVPTLFAAGNAALLQFTAVGTGLNTTDYASGQVALPFTAVGDVYNPPTVFITSATRLSQFAFAAGTASITAGQFSATASIQFNALAQGAQYVRATAELSWTINMPSGIAQARLWTTPPNFIEGSDTVWWSS